MTAIALAGWALVLVLACGWLRERRRLELAARAEHELRGPLGALTLAVEAVRRGRAGPAFAGVLDAQLERSRAGLADLGAALHGRVSRATDSRVALERLVQSSARGWRAVAREAGRGLRVDWQAGPVRVGADRGRLAQAVGNLLANAVEHGEGEVELRGRRVGDRVRVEVSNRGGQPRRALLARRRRPRGGRGRGLGIASRAAEEAGGRLEVASDGSRTVAALELPVEGQ